MANRAGIIKREQRKTFLFREFSKLFHEKTLEEPALIDLILTRVELSPGNGVCTIYFVTPKGEEAFNEALETLKLYGPSFRFAFAKLKESRHVPEFKFAYDHTMEKVHKMNQLLDSLKEK